MDHAQMTHSATLVGLETGLPILILKVVIPPAEYPEPEPIKRRFLFKQPVYGR